MSPTAVAWHHRTMTIFPRRSGDDRSQRDSTSLRHGSPVTPSVWLDRRGRRPATVKPSYSPGRHGERLAGTDRSRRRGARGADRSGQRDLGPAGTAAPRGTTRVGGTGRGDLRRAAEDRKGRPAARAEPPGPVARAVRRPRPVAREP